MTDKERKKLIENMARAMCIGSDNWTKFIAEARAALAVAEPAIKKDWQPMSTAPTDGTYVLAIVDVWSFSTGKFGKFLHWEPHVVCIDDNSDTLDANGDYVGWGWDDFKFWKPIEYPPNPEARKHD